MSSNNEILGRTVALDGHDDGLVGWLMEVCVDDDVGLMTCFHHGPSFCVCECVSINLCLFVFSSVFFLVFLLRLL